MLCSHAAPAQAAPVARDGAHERNRTFDLLLTKEVLYRLSYVSMKCPGMHGAHERNRTFDLLLTKEVLYRLSYVNT